MIKTIKTEYETPEYDEWKARCAEPHTITKEFYTNQIQSLETFVLSSRIIFPEFVIVEDLVFLEMSAPTKIDFKNRVMDDIEEWQASFNRIKLVDFFSASSEAYNDLFEATLEIVELGWETSLKKSFPKRRFVVETAMDDVQDPCVSFYEEVNKTLHPIPAHSRLRE